MQNDFLFARDTFDSIEEKFWELSSVGDCLYALLVLMIYLTFPAILPLTLAPLQPKFEVLMIHVMHILGCWKSRFFARCILWNKFEWYIPLLVWLLHMLERVKSSCEVYHLGWFLCLGAFALLRDFWLFNISLNIVFWFLVFDRFVGVVSLQCSNRELS